MRIVFRNMDTSELAKDIVRERLQAVLDRSTKLDATDFVVTLRMENSPQQAGPDFFAVTLACDRGYYKGLILTKTSTSLYVGLADLADSMNARLARASDSKRSRQVDKQRGFKRKMEEQLARQELQT